MISPMISPGCPEPLGAAVTAHGVNFAVQSGSATAIDLCLYAADGQIELARHRLPGRTGDVFHGHVPGLTAGARYGLRAHGPWQPERGHRFSPGKLLVDPYAVELDRVFALHPSMFAEDAADSAAFVPKAIVTPDGGTPAAGYLAPWDRTVLYELHVRGFTMRHPDIPPELRGTFAGLAHPASVAHLAGLGITSASIMPPAAWIEEPHLARLGLTNHWGYNPVALLAPDRRLAPGGWAEIRAAVAALAAAGIETIVDMVLNHTGEGDALGPTLSLRGLDNAGAYLLDADGRYANDSGCGNTLALNRPAMLRLAMDALRAWATRGGVHGFRFDLAATMGRTASGFDAAAPLLAAIGQDPVLRRLKLIAEPWDIGPGGYQLGAFPAFWGEWNDRFRDDVRRFWRGDPGMRGALGTRLAGSSDVFAARPPSRGVNYVVAHDGFTLADLVSYAGKHNAANGEDNRDGTDASFSWDNGHEGPTDDPAIRAARLADQKALLAILLLSRGTPMLSMGAEFGHSQDGNNNAYAQDNAISWLDWSRADPDLLAWTRRLIALRADHPALRHDHVLQAADVQWHGRDGLLSDGDWATDSVLVAVLHVDHDVVALLLNPTRQDVRITLPAGDWRILADSTGRAEPGQRMLLAARSVMVMTP